ncbi:hypothetical protein [Paenibacillus koleovorans]|uniref:hypothetical protein n=1 Tax=Paenibacillus koleovorans TaxID=121608 RepID=UPI000FDBAA04|nr:hypothetical protein [Paenibacillus koleovorans]
MHKVLDWAPRPDSYARPCVAVGDVERHLQALAAQQREDGGWAIHWPTVSLGCELEWRAA